MTYLDESTATLVSGLHKSDAAYCNGLAARFANLGIPAAAASAAIGSMVKSDAIPTHDIKAATPALFGLGSQGEACPQAYNGIVTAS